MGISMRKNPLKKLGFLPWFTYKHEENLERLGSWGINLQLGRS
jgi:hypothetical protein